MLIFDGVEGVRKAVGTHLGHSGWHTIDQARIDAFATATDDHQWIHVDLGRAARGPFGAPIAHGYLTLSLLPVLMWEVFRIDGLAMEINYGTERVRFPRPVVVDSRVRAGVELLALQPQQSGFQLRARVSVETDDGGKPACVAEVLSYLVPS